jgi:chromosome segregation ATPase
MDIKSESYQLMLKGAMLSKLERVIGRAFANCRRLRLQRDAANAQRDAANAQRDAANAQRDKAFKAGFKNLAAERNKAIGQAEGLLVELKQLKSTLAATSAEVEELREESFTLRAERDAARAERDIARTFLVLKTSQFETALAELEEAKSDRHSVCFSCRCHQSDEYIAC